MISKTRKSNLFLCVVFVPSFERRSGFLFLRRVERMITITNEDCMDLMARYPDKHFELAIVDPPYGIGDYQSVGDPDVYDLRARKKYGPVHWNNNIPDDEYFLELLRVSREQIIWGANYYNRFIGKRGAIVWDKKNDESRFSDCDIASCSMQKKITVFRYRWFGMLQEDMRNKEVRIHSAQKPVALYKWLLKNYAKPGDKILDTHLGSGSIAIACHDAGYDLTACEIDKDYYEAAMKRLEQHQKQLKLI